MKVSVLTPSIRPEGLKVIQECLAKQTFQSFEWLVELGIPERGGDLESAYNRMVKRAKGELLVFYQDYIKIQDDGLQQWWDNYQKYPKICFTGPKGIETGKLDDDGDPDYIWDWRAHGNVRNIQPIEWEIDWGSCPKQAIFDIGGFDETFDEGWAWGNSNAGLRLGKAGYGFMVDPFNEAIGEDHDKFMEHPFRGKNENHDRFIITEGIINDGGWKLNYL